MNHVYHNKKQRRKRTKEKGKRRENKKEKTNRRVEGRDTDRPINLSLFAPGFKQQTAMSLVYLGSSAVKRAVLHRLLSFRDLSGS